MVFFFNLFFDLL